MKRPIKFRVWDKENKLFVDKNGIYLSIDGAHRIEHDAGQYSWLDSRFEIDQFTGILDSSGQEVYESDVLSFVPYFGEKLDADQPRLGAVEHSNYDASFRVNEHHNGVSSWDFHTFYELKDVNMFYVKGNIHQNPELLI